jgi:cytochrome c biogenesis protein CcdA
MDDGVILKLNIALLFLVLFYVYPLKFLFSLAFGEIVYGAGKSPFTITADQFPELMAIYALGFVTIYSLFYLMYRRAFKKSDELGMTPLEKFDCASTIYRITIMVAIGLCSLFTSLFLFKGFSAGAGYVYFLIWPAIKIFYIFRNKLRKKLIHEKK